jgi:hypothetical protein
MLITPGERLTGAIGMITKGLTRSSKALVIPRCG